MGVFKSTFEDLKQAHCSEPHLPDPETLGWKKIAENKSSTAPDDTRSDSESLSGNHLMLVFHWMCKSPLQL